MMTKQEIFDKIWQYFVVEKHPRSVTTENLLDVCHYRHPSGDGRRCIVGLLIADEHYSDALETKPSYNQYVVAALTDSGVLPRDVEGDRMFQFFSDLQHPHDSVRGKFLDPERLKTVAAKWQIEVPAP